MPVIKLKQSLRSVRLGMTFTSKTSLSRNVTAWHVRKFSLCRFLPVAWAEAVSRYMAPLQPWLCLEVSCCPNREQSRRWAWKYCIYLSQGLSCLFVRKVIYSFKNQSVIILSVSLAVLILQRNQSDRSMSVRMLFAAVREDPVPPDLKQGHVFFHTSVQAPSLTLLTHNSLLCPPWLQDSTLRTIRRWLQFRPHIQTPQ